jgi:hypothetical protein
MGLQWRPRKMGNAVFAHHAAIDFGLPTGKYNDARPVNIGNHFVVVNPHYAFTYEPNSKLAISGRVHYLWSSINHDPFVGFGIKDTQAGQAFHANYAASYQVLKNFRIGFNGYWLQQLTDHEVDGQSHANSKERTVGLGPGIQLSSSGLWFRVNGYMETDVRNRPSGRLLSEYPKRWPQSIERRTAALVPPASTKRARALRSAPQANAKADQEQPNRTRRQGSV